MPITKEKITGLGEKWTYGDKTINLNDFELRALECGGAHIDWNFGDQYSAVLSVTVQPNPCWDPTWGDQKKAVVKGETYYRNTPEIMFAYAKKYFEHKKDIDRVIDFYQPEMG